MVGASIGAGGRSQCFVKPGKNLDFIRPSKGNTREF